MKIKKNDVFFDMSKYFSDTLAAHGETPRGVDWNGEESQVARFRQLCRIIEKQDSFSINDLGCGYGALYDFLDFQGNEFSYTGIDISEGMIGAAKKRHAEHLNAKFMVGSEFIDTADYGVASGIFNIHFNRSDEQWFSHIEATLDMLNKSSNLGFAFNCLTKYSDAEKMRDYLYYADPCRLFDLCKKRYSRNVALLHDYEYFEFTILVKKLS